MKIVIDSPQGKSIEHFEIDKLYWHVPTGAVCIPTHNGISTWGVALFADTCSVWNFVEPNNYRVFNGVVKLSNK